MAIPTVTEVEEFKEDLDDAEALVNGLGQVVTRLGGTKDSYSLLVSRIAHGDITAYSAASTYTEITDWVTESGIVYRPDPAQLPIGPESFDANKWFVAQGYTQGDGIVAPVETYAAALALPTSLPLGAIVPVYRDGISGNFVVTTGAIADSSGDRLLSDSTWSAAGKHLKRIEDGYVKNSSRVRRKLLSDQEDVYVLLQGDSTGNEDDEFFRIMAEKLSLIYPSYTFKYIAWNHAGSAWDAPVTITTGTGSQTIYFYNGSFSGSTHGYWTGNRNPSAYDSNDFDVIITNYGLNVATSWRSQAEQMAEYLFTLRQQQPKADILVTVQETDYNELLRTSYRVDAQKYVAQLYGCQVIDVYSLFIRLVESTGGVTSTWYDDALHPSAEGSKRWADLALYHFENDLSVSKCPLSSAPTKLPNGNFNSWLNGTSDVPTYWAVGSGESALRDTTRFETGLASARAVGIGTGTGVFYIADSDEVIARFKHWDQIVVAARIYSAGGSVDSGKAGKLFAAHSVSTSYTEIQNTQAISSYVDGVWRWAFLILEKSFFDGNSDFQIGVFSGEAGENVSVDRILISPTLFPNDSDFTSSWKYRAQASDILFAVAAGAVEVRGFNAFSLGEMSVQPGCKITATPVTPAASLIYDAQCVTAGTISVRVFNGTGSSIDQPATTWIFDVTAND